MAPEEISGLTGGASGRAGEQVFEGAKAPLPCPPKSPQSLLCVPARRGLPSHTGPLATVIKARGTHLGEYRALCWPDSVAVPPGPGCGEGVLTKALGPLGVPIGFAWVTYSLPGGDELFRDQVTFKSHVSWRTGCKMDKEM